MRKLCTSKRAEKCGKDTYEPSYEHYKQKKQKKTQKQYAQYANNCFVILVEFLLFCQFLFKLLAIIHRLDFENTTNYGIMALCKAQEIDNKGVGHYALYY